MRLWRSHDTVASLPRDPRADEYPMPIVPYGWYAVLRSAELRPGKVVSLHYFGRALIAFRGADGRATVRDAPCPHYGAHLGADAGGLITWDVSVDSTVARAHQHAAGARKKGICRSSRPVVSSPSPTTTGSDAPGAG